MSAKAIWRFLAWCIAIWMVSVQLTGCFDIDYSPDGKRIVFPWIPDTSGPIRPVDTQLAIMNVDGTGFRYLPNSSDGYAPAWSPSGKLIAFERDSKVQIQRIDSGDTVTLEFEGHNGFTWHPQRDILQTLVYDKEQSYAVWYDASRHQVLNKIEVSSPTGGDMHIQSIPNSDAFIGTFDNALWLYTPEGETLLLKDLTTTEFQVSADGRFIRFAETQLDPSKQLIKIHEYSFSDKKLREVPFPSLVRDVNVGGPAVADEIGMFTFSPDLSKALISVGYDTRTKDGDKVSRTFLLDLTTGSATPLWLKGEQFGTADWSPAGDSFILWTPLNQGNREVLTIRWFSSNGDYGIPILSYQSERHLQKDDNSSSR